MVVIERFSDDPYQSGTEVKDVHKIANGEKLVTKKLGKPRGNICYRGVYYLCKTVDSRGCISCYGRWYSKAFV